MKRTSCMGDHVWVIISAYITRNSGVIDHLTTVTNLQIKIERVGVSWELGYVVL